MPDHDFDQQLGALLRDTASDIGSQADIAPRVRQRLASNGGRRGSRQWLAAASMVAIVALLVGTFVWFKGAQLGSHPIDPSQITLHLDAAYADDNMTLVQYHIMGPRYDDHNIPIGYDLFFPTLTSARGTVLPEANGETSSDFATSGTAFTTFAPLPADELGARQTLTLTVDRMQTFPLQIVGNPPTVAANSIIHGTWRAAIEVTPSAGTSHTLHDAMQTHAGISIQPRQLESWPRSVRIVLRMGGLIPGSQENPTFATATTPGSGSQITLTAASDATADQRFPDHVYLLDPAGKPVQSPYTIPARGMLDIAVIYLQPPRGDVTLTFESISLSAGGASPRTITGSWTFVLTIPR